MALRLGKTRLLHLGVVLIAAAALVWAKEETKTVDNAPKIYTAAQADKMSGDGISFSISLMLLGSISFMMGLFYLVNSEDDDIKRYAWKVVSATISIFCAVLLFQAFNGLVEEYLIDDICEKFGLEEESEGAKLWECVVDIVQLVVWLFLMQIVLAISSGAVAEKSEWFFQPKNIEEVEIMLKSYAVLFAHISGFAALNAWGSIQQNVLGHTPLQSLLVIPIGVVGLSLLYKGFAVVREGEALGDDGELDEYEEAWIDEAQESEDDVAGLSLSFLTVQVLRLAISGDLPNEEGKENHYDSYHHSGSDCIRLLLSGFVFLAGLMIVLRIRAKFPKSPEDLKTERRLSKEELEEAEANYKKYDDWFGKGIHATRPLLILIVFCSCGMAWCFFYGTFWTVASRGWTDQDAMLQVIIAIIISGVSFFIIWCFDKIEDAGILGEDASMAIDATIDALGILIGFSWEQSFDVAVDTLSEDMEKYIPPTFGKLIMSFALTAIVFPAWKNYILPTEVELKEESTGVGKMKKAYEDKLRKHHENFLEEEQQESELDHAHLVLKLHRRRHHEKNLKRVKEDPSRKEPMKHFLFTSKGLTQVSSSSMSGVEGDDDLLESLLPECLQEKKSDEAELKFVSVALKVKQQLGAVFAFREGAKESSKAEE